MPNLKDNGYFWFFISLILCITLRLFLLPDQILLNDEWHSMNFVKGKSWFDLMFRYNRNANSIPMNLYQLFLLKYTGWSEMAMRLPSLVTGIATLPVLFLFVKKIFCKHDGRMANIVVMLYAISPFLILYSRISRAYSIVLFLASLSFLSLHLWATTGKRIYAVVYALVGALSIFFHITSAVTVFVPLGIIFVFKMFYGKNRLIDKLGIVPDLQSIFFLGVVTIVLAVAPCLPSLINNPWMMNIYSESDHAGLKTLVGFASLTAGTANRPLIILFWIAFASGQLMLLKRNPLFGISSMTVIILYPLGLMTANWETIHVPFEFTRFCITTFPLILITTSYGLNTAGSHLTEWLKLPDRFRLYPPLLFIGGLLATGPLHWIYQSPNNFTNHSAFNDSYQSINWDRSYKNEVLPGFVTEKKNMPVFYQYIVTRYPHVTAVIEYPMVIGDHCNLYYYYQHFHKKRIIVGYVATLPKTSAGVNDRIYGSTYIDTVLSNAGPPEYYRFRNMINMLDIDAINDSPATFIILHKDLFIEMFPQWYKGDDRRKPYEPLQQIDRLYREKFGGPLFEDENIIVFSMCDS